MILLVIDTQKSIMNDELYNFDVFVSNVKKLINVARKSGIEVIYVRHDDGKSSDLTKGKEGFEIYDEFKPDVNEQIFDKKVNSVFKNTGLLKYLKNKQENDLIITGLQTDYCIDASIKGAFEHGFNVFVPTNANTTTDNDFMTGEASYHYYNQLMWDGRYAKCISIDALIMIMKEGYENAKMSSLQHRND